MTRYADKTTVSSERSRAEIESTVMRYGATGFGYLAQGASAVIVFDMKGRRIKFILTLPKKEEFEETPVTRECRAPEAIEKLWKQGCRQRWRALLLVIKAKLEGIETGIETIEEAFLPHFVLPNGNTVGEVMLPRLDQICATGNLPPLLPGPTP